MAIKRTYIYNSNLSTALNNLYDALNEYAVPKFFTNISKENLTISCFNGETKILEIEYKGTYASISVTIFTENGSKTYGGGDNALFEYLWNCENGIMLFPNGYNGGFTITKDNDDNTVFVFTNNLNGICMSRNTGVGQLNDSYGSYANVIIAIGYDTGNVVKRHMICQPTGLLSSMSPIPIGDTEHYTPNAFILSYIPNNSVGILEVDGTKYISNGIWCVKD